MATTSPEARQRYDEVVAHADGLLLGLDFDGTLAPIVDDPGRAYIHPDAPELLLDLAGALRAVAVITGRPVRQVLDLGGIDDVAERLGERGRELFVLGQYGSERWSSVSRRIESPEPPPGLAALLEEMPRLLTRADAADAWVEEKGLAVAAHTRRTTDPQGAYRRLLPVLTEAAEAHGLSVEPGRLVVEVRAGSVDKGRAARDLADRVGAEAFCFVGDDLGDVEAFRLGRRLREEGWPVLLVCSDSGEQEGLREMADLTVAGPDGVMDLLRRLRRDTTRRDTTRRGTTAP